MELELAIWLIPLLPFAGFLFNGFFGRHLPRFVVGLVACGTVSMSFLIALTTFLEVRHLAENSHGHAAIVSQAIDWIRVIGLGEDGAFLSFIAEHKLVMDNLSCIMVLVVTGVGGLIHFYSTGYMADDKRYARYFAYLNLFTGFMLLLVMGSNLFLMFVGWEGVGLCSYLLIGFWFEDRAKAQAGMKAFIVNRIGDLSFTIGVLLLFVYVGKTFGNWTVDFGEIQGALEGAKTVDVALLTAIGILLFGGACGKSAQIPLYVWLPDAMAGPTPVSALIHAATMVTAGVYMVARMGFLYTLAPTALLVVAIVGAATALYAGTIALAQNDIKKVLAYSTVSQLGFMFMGVASGFYFAGIFHLMTHAFFKACLFLGSGSVIHGMGGEQDIRKMGGLFPKMKITAITFMLSSLALAGLPWVTSGFYSKEGILGALWVSGEHGVLESLHMGWLVKGLVFVGFLAAGFTAFYMTRLVIKTFFGRARWKDAPAEDHGHDDAHGHGHGEPHESPLIMWLPLVILAILSIGGAFIFCDAHYVFGVEEWLGGHEAHEMHKEVPKTFFLILSIIMSGGGILLGIFLFGVFRDIPKKAAKAAKPVHELLLNKYYMDEVYQAGVIEPLLLLEKGVGTADNYAIDGAVNTAATAAASASQNTGIVDNEVVDGGVNGAGWIVGWKGKVVRRLQTGNIKAYLTTTVVGGLFLIAAFCVYLSRDRISELLRGMFG
ncbi:MAG: NADH-quinone oxidoreductase subunit L [Planctomycetota bacterium]|jgi:NADH-quinone oxidoreductase subunit L